ncbi:tetratricopeptide repeat protein [Nostoc sp.]|uniref:tetratricopeptide repeat protein n=1 Tax=Nostoc sp. TaxID=1180 RepID=UPI002FF8A3CC
MRSPKFLAFLLILPLVINSPVAIAQSTSQLFDQRKAAHDARDYQKAENNWRQVIRREPSNAQAHYRLGKILQQQKRSDEAIAEFREAIKLNSKHSYAYNSLGTVLQYNQNKLDEAIINYRKAIELNPSNFYAYWNWGNALVAQNRVNESIKLYSQALKLDPRNPYKYTSLGRAYYLQKNFKAAIAVYRRAIELNPKNFYAYIDLGNALTKQKRFNDAIKVYFWAIQVDPYNADSYISLGRVYYLKKDFPKAISFCNKAIPLYNIAIQKSPKDPYLYNGLGIALMAQGKLQEASTKLQHAINLDPNFQEAQNNLKKVERLLALQNPKPITENTQRSPGERVSDEPYKAVATALIVTEAALVLQNPKPNTENTQRSPEEGVSDELYKAATVLITTKAADGNLSQGTGWVLKQKDKTVWVVTTGHVVSNERLKQISKDIFVEFYSSNLPDAKRPRYPATIEKITNFNNSGLDLAVLKVTEVTSDIKSFNDRLGVNLRGTRSVTIIGHPITVKSPWTIVSGKVINQDLQARDMDIDANLAEGNSGSPVVDEQQQLIGMVVQIGTKRDISPDPQESTPPIPEDTTSTRGVGKAYRIDKVIEQLRNWNILK